MLKTFLEQLQKNLSRDNHYVPIWYQKRFLGSKSQYHYLDRKPQQIKLPDGRVKTVNEVQERSPKKCFWQKDLYTTHFLGIPNDEIEKLLFGAIDNDGAIGLQAVLEQDISKLHSHLMKFLEFMDVQKLRTPKGLDWVKSKYPSLDQMQLMREMQGLRQMHCTIMSESVREIVSAENSSVKFIISDHPVTTYNAAYPPDHQQCQYPSEPPIALKGSQTIFPLDQNHCLILTNLEYAQNPNASTAVEPRTHARSFDNTIIKLDEWIVSRKLSEMEVQAINHIIKARSRQFIASGDPGWLYPERQVKDSWEVVGKVLLPPKDELYMFEGEMYIGYEGGGSHYQDALGRTEKENPHLIKNAHGYNPPPNAPCTCGSGKKFKKCCSGKPANQRPSAKYRGIRERNIFLCDVIQETLGLDKGKTWDDVRRELSDEQVKEIYSCIGFLWPRSTNLLELLPKADPNVLRGLYSGIIDPRLMVDNVINFSFYCDEILIMTPFLNPNGLKPEFNPLENPGHFKEELLRNVLLILQLLPLIQEGIINLIPDPCDFNTPLRKQIREFAKARVGRWRPDKKKLEDDMKFFMEDVKNDYFAMSEEGLTHMIKKWDPNMPPEEIIKLIAYMKKRREENPLTLLQPIEPGEGGAKYRIGHMRPNHELGLFLAQFTGSFVFTDHPFRREEILGAINLDQAGENPVLKPLEEFISSVKIIMPYGIDPYTVLAKMLRTGKLGAFRKALRDVWAYLISKPDTVTPAAVKMLVKDLTVAYDRMQKEWKQVQEQFKKDAKSPTNPKLLLFTRRIECRMPAKGFGRQTVYRLLAAHAGHYKYLPFVPLVVFLTKEVSELTDA